MLGRVGPGRERGAIGAGASHADAPAPTARTGASGRGAQLV